MSRTTQKMKQKLSRKPLLHPVIWLLLATLVVVSAFGLAQIPEVRDRMTPRIARLRVAIKEVVAPPEKSVFVPQGAPTSTQAGEVIATATLPAPTDVPVMVVTVMATPTVTEVPVAMDTPEPIYLPPTTWLEGFTIEYQTFNNCGPANLSMLLNYWGYLTSQADLKPFLRPSREDRNVNLYEMRDYVNANTQLRAVMRYGGDLTMLKRLVAAGFPVLLERGHTDPKEGWMGHYSIVNAYNDDRQRVHIPDSLVGNLYLSYEDLMKDWLHFANIYMVVYPIEREYEVLDILGSQADEVTNLVSTSEQLVGTIYETSGQDQFFAWYSQGTILTELGRYADAAEAYDQAFLIYPTLEMKQRPWRLTWYQTGPYRAYYEVGRYQDTLSLAIKTIDDTTEDSLPETWWWAGRAAAALGQYEDAAYYFRQALYWYPGWQLAIDQLAYLGLQP